MHENPSKSAFYEILRPAVWHQQPMPLSFPLFSDAQLELQQDALNTSALTRWLISYLCYKATDEPNKVAVQLCCMYNWKLYKNEKKVFFFFNDVSVKVLSRQGHHRAAK